MRGFGINLDANYTQPLSGSKHEFLPVTGSTFMSFQPRFDEARGIYRDCKWCHGAGCLACPAEADKEYKRQFPDGPQPIATFPATDDGVGQAMKLINDLLAGKNKTEINQ